jgi:HEAT repeat protein
MVEEAVEACPACGHRPKSGDEESYEDKLLAALEHPVADVRMVAVEVLGQRRSQRAVPALCKLLADEETDFYLLRQVVKALASIGTPAALRSLGWAARRHPSRLVRDEAGTALAAATAGRREGRERSGHVRRRADGRGHRRDPQGQP